MRLSSPLIASAHTALHHALWAESAATQRVRGFSRVHLPVAPWQRCSRLLAKMVSPTGRKDLGEEYSYYGTVNPWLQARPTGSPAAAASRAS